MERINYSSGSKWEDIVGYSRAVKVGNVIEVTGTVASGDDGNVVGKNDGYAQTKYIYQKMEKVLRRAGAAMKDVVRVRMFVTDISKWQEYGKAHSEFFKEIKPCNTMVEVKALIEPDYLIEIEATAQREHECRRSSHEVREYALEGDAGDRGVGPMSAELRIFLPGSDGWIYAADDVPKSNQDNS